MAATEPRPDLARGRMFRLRLLLARGALAFERIWPTAWPTLAVLGLFVVVSLFNLWQMLPAWLHAIGLVAFAGALGLVAYRTLWRLRLPDREDGLGRIEQASGLAHQPLRGLGDRQAGGDRDAASAQLWRLHQERLLASLAKLRIGRPRSDLPRRDPWAMRAALLLVLVVALVDAGGQAGDRLRNAFLPGFGAVAGPAPELTLWITPPAYTGRAPIFVDGRVPASRAPVDGVAPDGAVRVPDSSMALLQVHHRRTRGGELIATLGARAEPLRSTGGDSAEGRFVIDRSGRLAVEVGGDEIGGWSLELIPDRAPEIAFAERPSATHRGVLRTAFEAEDDYGVVDVTLRLARAGGEDAAERIRLLRPAGAPAEIADSAYLDLTPHPLAGLPVALTLEARDAIGQHGQSETVEIVLPAREFQNPLARAIIEQRRRFVAEPARRAEVAGILNGLAQTPHAAQAGTAVQLALRLAGTRLFRNQDEESGREVVDLLWEVALHLEDGALSLAERDLRELQRELQQALAEDAPDEEIERLMAELERALDAFLDALMRQALDNMDLDGETPQTGMMPPDATMLERRDLQSMLEQAREMMRTGARDAARQMLSQLQQMLENLSAQTQMGQSQGEQAMSALEEMIRRQQELLERSFEMGRDQSGRDMPRGRQGQQGEQGMPQQGMPQQGVPQPGGDGDEAMAGAAMDQDALRRALGEMMRRMGEAGMPIPRALGQAELGMRDARDALGEGDPGGAADSQAQVIDQLQQGGQALMQSLMEHYGEGMGMAPGMGQPPFMAQPGGRDPLGRSMFNQGGADMHGDYVPDELDLGRARRILEELYRRSGERERPAEELDYIERLLRRF